MYVILTSKPGQFHTEISDGFRACETYDYLFYGEKKARFTIAELQRPTPVQLVEEDESGLVNKVPSKFLESFDTIEAARKELNHLTTFGNMDTKLERVA